MLNHEQVRFKIEELREKINHHNYRYYVLDDPQITDADFDALMSVQELEAEYPQFISADSPTQRVGGAPASTFAPVRHTHPCYR